MLYCDIVNCRYNRGQECHGPKREKLLQQYNGGNVIHLHMACADHTLADF